MLDSREELGGWFDAPKRLPNCITLGRARVARAGERTPAPAAVCRPAAHDTSSAKTHSENRIINYFVGGLEISAVGVSSVVGVGAPRLRACALRPLLPWTEGAAVWGLLARSPPACPCPRPRPQRRCSALALRLALALALRWLRLS